MYFSFFFSSFFPLPPSCTVYHLTFFQHLSFFHLNTEKWSRNSFISVFIFRVLYSFVFFFSLFLFFFFCIMCYLSVFQYLPFFSSITLAAFIITCLFFLCVYDCLLFLPLTLSTNSHFSSTRYIPNLLFLVRVPSCITISFPLYGYLFGAAHAVIKILGAFSFNIPQQPPSLSSLRLQSKLFCGCIARPFCLSVSKPQRIPSSLVHLLKPLFSVTSFSSPPSSLPLRLVLHPRSCAQGGSTCVESAQKAMGVELRDALTSVLGQLHEGKGRTDSQGYSIHKLRGLAFLFS